MVEEWRLRDPRGKVDSIEVEAKDDEPAARFTDEHLNPVYVGMDKTRERRCSRLNDRLLERLVQTRVCITAVAHTLHVLILGEECIANSRHQHHGDKKGNDDIACHDCSNSQFRRSD